MNDGARMREEEIQQTRGRMDVEDKNECLNVSERSSSETLVKKKKWIRS